MHRGRYIVTACLFLVSVAGQRQVRAASRGHYDLPNGCLTCHGEANQTTDMHGESLTPSDPNRLTSTCLSCHDGSAPSGVPGGSELLDIGNSHPVGIPYQSNRDKLASVTYKKGDWVFASGTMATVKLFSDSSGRPTVQCVSCHDPHGDPENRLLRQSYRTGATNLCRTCHSSK